MSKQRIIEGIDSMFKNLKPPSPMMPAFERRVCIQNRENEHAWIKREVASVFEQRDELLDALIACLDKGKRWHPCDPVVLQARAAIAKARGGA